MQKECWKATFEGHSWLSSYFIKDYLLHYQVGQTTVPKFGRIYCFDSPENTFEFIFENVCFSTLSIVVFKGLAENPTKPLTVARIDSIYPYWRAKAKKKQIPDMISHSPPKGTLTTKAFTPTKEYSLEEFTRWMEENKL